MLHKMGLLLTLIATVAILGYHWALAQVETMGDLKDWLDAGIGLSISWFFIWYLIQKEKVHTKRLKEKDDEIKRLNDKITNNKK